MPTIWSSLPTARSSIPTDSPPRGQSTTRLGRNKIIMSRTRILEIISKENNLIKGAMKWKEMLLQEMVMLVGIMNKKGTTMSKGINQNKEKAMKIGKIMSQIRQMGTNMEATIQTETR